MKEYKLLALPQLVLIDCDGVLYDPAELDINAMCYAFNDVCDDFGLQDEKFTNMEDCTYDKPVKGFCKYIEFVAQKLGIDTEDFIRKMVDHVDYSHLSLDESGILQKLTELSHKYKLCICSNNHKFHLNKVLKMRLGVEAAQLPIEVFDIMYAKQNGEFYTKESATFVAKLAKHYNIKADDFLWIDDNPKILEKVQSYGSRAVLITKQKLLIDVLQEL
ncbi:MAG: HAD family hydrolase [Alphaproteobacteria bacterium]|nr:HAD family hydrolase [Alphaproteobacteria bacterium]